jgi:ubiquinone/menaquinone biosynthesis C-methylase UbiE
VAFQRKKIQSEVVNDGGKHEPFESWAKTYDDEIVKRIKRDFGVNYDQIVRSIVGLANVKRSNKVLDVATGTGSIAISLAADKGCQITGINISEAMLAKARENVNEFGLENATEFMKASAEDILFNDGTFDVVTCSMSLHHTNVRKALSEMVRVLKPNGRLAIADISANRMWRGPIGKIYRFFHRLKLTITRRNAEHVEFHTEEEWIRLLSECKLRDIELTCTNHSKYWWSRGIIIVGGKR